MGSISEHIFSTKWALELYDIWEYFLILLCLSFSTCKMGVKDNAQYLAPGTYSMLVAVIVHNLR